MAVTLKQIEAAPATYPDAPANLSDAATALDPAMVWQRLESYTAYRWSERAVTWIVEGPGIWTPPLAPMTIATTEIWESGAWQAITLDPSPFGAHCLDGNGPYRFISTVGADAGDVPAVVVEAFRRLAEYIAADLPQPGVRSETMGDATTVYAAAPLANALQNSGAADLLRPYRRAP